MFLDWGVIDKVSVLPDYQLEERDFHIPNVKCYELTFKGTRDGLVYARVVLPKSDKKVPVNFPLPWLYGTVVGLDEIC